MARAIAADGTRPWRCPICDAEGHGTNWATDRALAQHIAMMDGATGKEGAPHTDWRREHGISPPKMVAQIRQIINANPSLFRMSGET